MTTGQHSQIVLFSGGAASWAAARRVVDRHGVDETLLLFTDTMMEDEDLYRFLDEAVENIGSEFVRLADGRDPWQIFHDRRFLGNTRVDPCSRILKRELARKWIEEHYSPETTTIVLGLDWTEMHRVERASGYWEPYRLSAPLTEPPAMDKRKVLDELAATGIALPRLYGLGFPHNNCGGFCIKAGQAHFELLLRTMPERYAYHEAKEEELRVYLDKDVAILRDRRTVVCPSCLDEDEDDDACEVCGGRGNVPSTLPMTMRVFRERIEAADAEGEPQLFDDWGGCGCMVDDG